MIITEVYDDGPADRSDLRRGDLVLRIDGREVFDERGLKFLAATKSPGEDVVLDVLRGGKEQTLVTRLSAPPGTSEAEVVLLEGRHPFTGAEVAELSPRLAEELGRDPFESGVLVNRVMRGAYARRIVRSGDIIVEIDGQSIKTIEDLDQALDRDSGRWDIEINRNGRTISGSITL